MATIMEIRLTISINCYVVNFKTGTSGSGFFKYKWFEYLFIHFSWKHYSVLDLWVAPTEIVTLIRKQIWFRDNSTQMLVIGLSLSHGSRDKTTLTPGFDESPFSGYTDLSCSDLSFNPASTAITASKITIDYTDENGLNLEPYLKQLGNETNTVKGYIHFINSSNRNDFAIYRLKGFVDLSTNYYGDIEVAYLR